MRKQKVKIWILKGGLFALYFFISMLVGEFHPFTRVPMYEQMPRWAYAFYLTQSDQTLIPLRQISTLAPDALSHWYASLCQKSGSPCGDGKESQEALRFIGRALMEQLSAHGHSPSDTSELMLWQVIYRIDNGKLLEEHRKLYPIL